MATIDRKMAEIVKVDDVLPHPNADLLEICKIRGWKVVTKIGEFKKGEHAAYFSIDAWIPNEVAPFLSKDKEPREFNGVKGERLRTVKLRKQISQGLLLPLQYLDGGYIKVGDCKKTFRPFEEDIQDALNIQKYEPPIPVSMSGEVRCHYPTHLSPKSDQWRVQNLVDDLESFNGITFEITEKLDGSSASFIVCDDDYHVCSRNLSLKEGKNIFWQIENKFDILNKIRQSKKNVCVQGEVIGQGIQKNAYNTDLDFYVYNVYDIDNKRFMLPNERRKFVNSIGLKHVPVLETFEFYFDDVEDILGYADGKSKLNNNTNREGIVFKSVDDEIQFKAISNNWLLKNDG